MAISRDKFIFFHTHNSIYIKNEALKREMFSTPSNRHTDMENLRRDRNNVARDCIHIH